MIKSFVLFSLIIIQFNVKGNTPGTNQYRHYNADVRMFNPQYAKYQGYLEETVPNLQLTKADKYNKAGNILLICGAVSTALGVILMANADEIYYTSTSTNSGTNTEGDPKGALGFVFTTTGIAGVITGMIFKTKAKSLR